MAASSREIDRADKRNRNQKNDGSQQRVDDHIPLRKSYYLRCTAVSKDTACVFKGLQWITCAEKSPKADNCGHQPTTTEYWNPARGNCSGFRFLGPINLAFAEPDRAITGVDGQRLTATIHLAVHFRVLERSFYGDWNAKADVAVAGASVNICLKVGRQNQVHAAVTCADRPTRHHLGTREHPGVHAAVARFHVERVESSGNSDMPIAGVRLHLAVQVSRFNGAVSRAEAHVPFEVINRDAAVAGVKIDRAAERTCLHGAIAGMYVHSSMDGFRLYGPVACLHLQVGLARHADFDVQSPRIMAPREPPISCDPRCRSKRRQPKGPHRQFPSGQGLSRG